MRVLLRDIESGEYFAEERKWAADAEQAHDFGSTSAALEGALESGRGGLEIVLTFEDRAYDVAMPVGRARDTRFWRRSHGEEAVC